jgi:putative DNA primase/helicase
MSNELDSYLETLGDVTEQECMANDIINDGRLPDDYGIEKVNAHNEKNRARIKRNAANKEVTQNGVTFADLNLPIRDYLTIGDSLTGKDDPENLENKFECNNSGVTGVTGVTTSNDEDCSGNTDKKAGVTGLLDNAINPNEEPPPNIQKVKLERPCYGFYDDFNEFGKAGVYYHGIKTDKKGDTTEPNGFICDPLHIDAGSCDTSDHNYGLMLRFRNQRFKWKIWVMPLEMLSGSCEDLRSELLKMGLRIDHHKRNMLPSYLQAQRPKKQLECALKVGWHGDIFVLPDRVIGNRKDIFFQTDHAITAEYGQLGTLEDWQQNISQYCIGNPLLLFQTSISFAGALLKKCHIDYAGFHIFGDSSTGKSTGHKMAGSIWGSEGFRKSWKATGNGLEAAAVLFNDGLLALDELGDSDPREVNQIIYALGNGTGKQRANVKGSARPVSKWRIVLLSNGEKTLESFFQERGLTVKAGQSVRLLQIPVFGKHGAFDDLHGMKDGRLFSDTLQKNTTEYYGKAGIAYLDKLVNDTQDFGGLLEAALQKFTKDGMESQEQRAARAFALVALAGELATEYKITGWGEGAALEAAITCFEKWRNHRGTGATEDKVILEAVRDFISRYGDSRFSLASDNSTTTMSAARAGWYLINDESRTYLFSSAGLKDATTGYDQKRVIEALTKAGWLERGNGGKSSRCKKINGSNDRFYFVTLKEPD